jgi:hypothetical protein
MKTYSIAFVFGVIVLISCSDPYAGKRTKPLVTDTIQLFSEADKAGFTETGFAGGLIPWMVATEEVDLKNPGKSADGLFKEYTYKHPNPDAFKKRGFLVVVSKNPQLIQIRAGSDIRDLLLSKGITAGQEYLILQQIAGNETLSHALSLLYGFLESRLPEIEKTWWWQNLQQNKIASFVSEKVEKLGIPSNSFYGENIVKPVYNLRLWEIHTLGTWWVSFIAVALLIFIASKLSDELLNLATRKILYQPIRWAIHYLVTACISILLIIPAISSAILFSSGRLEDRMMLEAMGFHLPDYLSINPSAFGAVLPLWLVVLLAVAGFLKGMAPHPVLFTMSKLPVWLQQQLSSDTKSNMPNAAGIDSGLNKQADYLRKLLGSKSMSGKTFSQAYQDYAYLESGKAGIWALVSFAFFSKAVVLAILFLWLVPVLVGYILYFNEIAKFNKTYPNNSISIKPFILYPLIATLLALGLYAVDYYRLYLLFVPAFLMASGILPAVFAEYFFGPVSNFWFWAISLSLPVYFLSRILAAIGHSARKAIRIAAKFIFVSAVCFAMLLYFYYQGPRYAVGNGIHRLIPALPGMVDDTIEVSKPQKKGVLKVNVLNLRKDADLTGKILYKLNPKDTFTILATDREWWYIRHKDTEGYIFSNYARELVGN